jgi:uncharacterized oxidoreductase
MSTLDLTGHTILVTGGATGIGFALAKMLSERGNLVIICGRSETALHRAQAQVPDLVTRVCDIADPQSRRAMVEWLEADHSGLGAIINNAGIQRQRDFNGDPDLGSLDQEVAINLTAPIHLIAQLLPALKRQEKAWIVNVSSGLAFSPMADVPVYCATKAAIHSFTMSLRHQLRDTNVAVVEIAPPIVETGLGGDTRSGGTAHRAIMSPEAFASEAMAQLAAGKVEILVGLSVETRRAGEAMFERMNSRSSS